MSFACIAFDPVKGPEQSEDPLEQVVLAMYTQEGVDDTVAQDTVARYTEEFGDPSEVLPGTKVAYWFWTRPKRWLMVNTAVDHQGKRFVTVALGAPQAMRELHMAPDVARVDQARAIESLALAPD